MSRCYNCGWDNPEASVSCEMCGAPLSYDEFQTYDVFISYSRKDYVDEAGNVIPNNMLSKIKDTLRTNGISYWFDEEGIYSGDEFASVLTRAIRNSKVFLFVSSINSNQSKWTSNEISTALEFKKPIIPFRIDDSSYNDSVMMKIISFDYVECKDEEKAMSKLLRAVKHHLPKSERQQRKSIINIPDGARWATVIFDVEGKRTEKVFSYEGGEAKILHEKVTAKDLRSDHDAPITNGFKLLKNRKVLWVIIMAILFVVIGGGLMSFCHEGKTVYKPLIETIPNGNVKCQPVDLGLTSGTMWADRNIGASTATDFGNLYSWGEIKTKEDYSISTYIEQLKPLQKITQSKHDVAMAELGEEWSMPTEEQIKELLSECKWYWKKIDGHNGFEIEGKNGNRIFLPASGWNRGTVVEYENQYGYYWTSERSSNSRFARSLQFPKEGKGVVGNGDLHVGRSVRAVFVMCEAVAE